MSMLGCDTSPQGGNSVTPKTCRETLRQGGDSYVFNRRKLRKERHLLKNDTYIFKGKHGDIEGDTWIVKGTPP